MPPVSYSEIDPLLRSPPRPWTTHPDQSLEWYRGYVIVAASLVMMAIIWGIANTFGVFFEPFIKEFGWTRTVTSSASALNSAVFGVLCVFFSASLSERFGARRVMTVCGVVLGLSYLLLAQLACMWEIYLYFGIFAVIGISPTLPAGIDGAIPEDCTEVLVNLNVIVYGLSRDLLQQTTGETVACLESTFREKLVIEAI